MSRGMRVYLVYEDERGQVVLDRGGTKKMASGFVQGVNVEAATASLSVQDRFTDITVMYSSIDQTSEGAGRQREQQARAGQRHRPEEDGTHSPAHRHLHPN